MDIKLDKWQEEVLAAKGNLAICAGRQVGKSTIISEKAANSALRKKKTIMVIAATERQAYLLFEKILSNIHNKAEKQICRGAKKPTKHKICLLNGSVIHCLPTGDTGYGIRGYTIDELYADEAHFIKDEVWAAVSPMLATTGGTIILLSTPFGTEGYFFRCFHDKKFKQFHISTETVAEGRPPGMKESMQQHLKDEKERMTRLQYQQEYLGLFVGGVQRLFTDKLIDECCVLPVLGEEEKKKSESLMMDKFLGVDIARMGGDETVLLSVHRITNNLLEMYDLEIPEAQRLTATSRLILHYDRKYNYKKIYIDEGGLGGGVYDELFENPQTKRKIVGINNASRGIDKEKGQKNPRKKRLLKEDLYNNLVRLMEQERIKLLDLPEVRHSLRSIQYEITDGGVLRIYGNYSHVAEALIRAAWCMNGKLNKLWVR